MQQSLPAYKYTSLARLPDSGKVSVYGVIRNVTTTAVGASIVEIEDEEDSAILRLVKDTEGLFKDLRVNDILRIHRAQIGSYGNELAIIVALGVSGCHAVSWRGNSDDPHLMTSKTCTISEQDTIRLHSLRKWLMIKEASVQSSDVPETRYGSNSANRKAARDKQLCPTISAAEEIPQLGKKFFNWHAQVLGVYKAKGDTFTVFVRVWDGTKPSFPAYRSLFRANSDAIETTYCEIPTSLFHLIEAYVIDVWCYGDWSQKAMKLKVGDIVFLGNIRNYLCNSTKTWSVTMHEGGLRYNRALDVVMDSDPNHFEISKRCADALSLRRQFSDSLLATTNGGCLTPIISNDVRDRSTPKATTREEQMVIEEETPCVNYEPTLGPSTTNEGQVNEIMSTDFSVEDFSGQIGRANFVVCDAISSPCSNSLTPKAATSHEKVDIQSGTRKSPSKSLTGIAVVDRDRVTEAEVEDTEEFSQWLDARQGLASTPRTDVIRAARQESGSLSNRRLVEEIEEVLHMKVGDHVGFANFIEAELAVLSEPAYLRNAVIFTGKCVNCDEEVIVERCSSNWCPKCFVEQKKLSTLRYSYRIVVPSIYRRSSNGQLAQLCLAIAGDVWSSIPASSDRLLVSKVMRLYSEKVFRTFIAELNHVIRLAEAIMKRKKFSVIDGKVIAMNRVNGSISMFVDRCLIADSSC